MPVRAAGANAPDLVVLAEPGDLCYWECTPSKGGVLRTSRPGGRLIEPSRALRDE